MTRVAIIADPHVANHRRWGGPLVGGLNDRGRQCVEVLRRSHDTAAKEACQGLFVLGDLFHNTKPTPPLVRATADALSVGPMKTYVLLGNHDKQSEEEHDHAAASMSKHVEIVDKPRVVGVSDDLDVWVIPYTAGEAKDWLTAGMATCGTLARGYGRKTIVLTHLGIFDDDTPGYLKDAKDAVSISHVRWLCREVHERYRIDGFFAGNWHSRREWHEGGLSVVIPGTVCPATFSDDPKASGFMAYYDTSRSNGWTMIAGPRFMTMGLAEFKGSIWRKENTAPDKSFYYHLKVSREELAEALELAKDVGANRFVEVTLDEEETRASVQKAARAAALAGQGNAILAAEYLSDVREPGTAEGVARRFEEYRKAAL